MCASPASLQELGRVTLLGRLSRQPNGTLPRSWGRHVQHTAAVQLKTVVCFISLFHFWVHPTFGHLWAPRYDLLFNYAQCFAISEVRNWLASCPSTAWQFCEENLPLDSDCFILVCSDGVWDATQLGRCPSGGPWKSEEGWKMEIVWCFKWPNCESPKWIQRVAPNLKWIQHPNDGRFTNQYLTSSSPVWCVKDSDQWYRGVSPTFAGRQHAPP